MSDLDTEEGLSGDGKIVAEAKRRFGSCQEWESQSRKLFWEDVKFANGDSDNQYQWPGSIYRNRDIEDRPCLTINKTRQHNLQIINDGKQNKSSVKIRPLGNEASYEAAEIFEGLVRHTEYISNAQDAYDTARKFQVEGGIGYWRIVTDYVGDDSFDQEIYIRQIKDPSSVYLDKNISEKDGSDARYGFIFDDMSLEEYRLAYPDDKALSSTSTLGNTSTVGWITSDTIRVAEYYRKVKKKDRLITFTDPNTGAKTVIRASKLPKEVSDAVIDDPATKHRAIDEDVVEWYLIAGEQIIDRAIWPGKYIPIVRIIGEETIIDGKLDRKGHTRNLKDPQRQYNYWSPLALDTPLPTPSGWTTMGDVKVNDWLLDESGSPVKVSGTSPVYVHRKCYKVNFDDGSSIVADAEHKWTVEERGRKFNGRWEWSDKTISTAELTPKKHFIKTSKPLDLPDIDLLIDPYLLGVWLGDGTSACAQITAGASDMEDMRQNIIALNTPYTIGAARMYRDKSAGVFTVHGLKENLHRLGLIGNKHIPEIYLRASKRQREALLQGLMDTDGSISARKQCDFTNTNHAIIHGFSELIRSVGIKAVFCRRKAAKRVFPSGRAYDCEEATQFSFSADPDHPVFRLKRKLDVQAQARVTHWRRTKRHRISLIEEVPSVPVKCVSIESESHLFLAGEGMVPTHNSASVEFAAMQSKTPWITPAKAVEGFETFWGNANRQNYAYLPYNHMDDTGEPIPAPTRQQPPSISPAYIEGMKISQQEMMMVSGQQQANFGEPGNEKSGKAINARQRQGENATYHFIDNEAIGLRYTGKILIDLYPKIYDTENRVIKVIGEDGTETSVLIDPNARQAWLANKQKEGLAAQGIFNPSVGEYDVMSDVGPAYATQRQEAFSAISQILTQAPELVTQIGDILFKVADFPLADKIAERLERGVPAYIKGEAPPPEVQQAQQQVQMMTGQMQKMQSLLSEMTQQLAEEKLKLRGKDQMRDIDAYKAITDRLDTIAKHFEVTPKDKASMLHDLMVEEHRASLIPVETASAPTLESAAQQ